MTKEYTRKIPVQKASFWESFKPALIHLDIELTERCNQNCVQCYINRPAYDAEAEKKELTTDEIKNILEQASALGCLDVGFTGGEPLLRKDFEEIYLFTRSKGFRIQITTNATLITSRLAELFQRIPPLHPIRVSVYGLDRNSYESNTRTPGSFRQFEKGIQLLLDHQVHFVARAAMHPMKKDQLDAFESWVKKIPRMDTYEATTSRLFLRARGDQSERNKEIKKLRLEPHKQVSVEERRKEESREDLKRFCSQFCSIYGSDLFRCSAGHRRGSIDAYGNFQLCLKLKHPETLFDLRTGTLEEALTDFSPVIRKTKSENPEYLEKCGRCFLRSLCEQCPAISWMENKTLDGWPRYFCEITHVQARSIGLLREGESAWEVLDWEDRVKELERNDPLGAEGPRGKDMIKCT